MTRRSVLLLACCLCWSACDSRRLPQSGDGSVASPRDATARTDGAPQPDQGCTCPSDKVMTVGACVPTDQLYACVTSCDVKAWESCPPDQRCDPWAASTSCYSAQALPACVPEPAMGFDSGTLRIAPTSGNAADEVTVSIEGGSFYVGALSWFARVAGGEGVFLDGAEGGPCRAKFTFTPPGPGLHPVEVSYGDGGGSHGWVLAGFYLASGGIPPTAMAQPGLRCSSALPCAMASPYICSCIQGRCRCNEAP